MMQLAEPNLSLILTTLGLILDISGALILATDLLKKFKGALYEHERDWSIYGIPETVDGALPRETVEHKRFEVEVLQFRKRGLVVMIVGFVFQLAGVWIRVV